MTRDSIGVLARHAGPNPTELERGNTGREHRAQRLRPSGSGAPVGRGSSPPWGAVGRPWRARGAHHDGFSVGDHLVAEPTAETGSSRDEREGDEAEKHHGRRLRGIKRRA